MDNRHFTLKIRSNIIFIVLWIAGIMISLFISQPKPLITILVGILFGLPCGILQRRGLSENTDAFLAAGTALDVREVMANSKSGKRALQIQWLGAGAILILSAIQPANPILSALSGYCALMLVRDVITLKMVEGQGIGKKEIKIKRYF